jgi:hypothetical protein
MTSVRLKIARNGNPGNPAICTHLFTANPASQAQLVAQVIAAYASLGSTAVNAMAGEQVIQSAEVQLGLPSDGFSFIPVVFPLTEYALLDAAAAAATLPAFTGFGQIYGPNTSLPAGVGLLVREATSLPRRRWGKSFLPFPAQSSMNTTTGQPISTADAMVQVWATYLKGTAPGCQAATPAVWSPTTGLAQSIASYALSPQFARLRSRMT